jgi:hypothetical protein
MKMDIKIGGTNNSTYESIRVKNSQTNAQKTDNQESVEKDNKSAKSANNIDLATKYVSSQGDTVEISREGASALESSKTNTFENASKSTDKDSSSNESTTNLSQYTDSKLKELYAKGKISASQYNSELASRGQDSSNIDISPEK